MAMFVKKSKNGYIRSYRDSKDTFLPLCNGNHIFLYTSEKNCVLIDDTDEQDKNVFLIKSRNENSFIYADYNDICDTIEFPKYDEVYVVAFTERFAAEKFILERNLGGKFIVLGYTLVDFE